MIIVIGLTFGGILMGVLKKYVLNRRKNVTITQPNITTSHIIIDGVITDVSEI